MKTNLADPFPLLSPPPLVPFYHPVPLIPPLISPFSSSLLVSSFPSSLSPSATPSQIDRWTERARDGGERDKMQFRHRYR